MTAAAQPTLWDAAASEQAAQAGIDQAAANHASLLTFARELAREIARSRADRCCTADDVQAEIERRGISVRALGNAAGGLFRGTEWTWTGRWQKSARLHAHANPLRIWHLSEVTSD